MTKRSRTALGRVATGVAIFLVLMGSLRLLRSPLHDRFPLSETVYDRDGTLLRLTTAGDEKFRLWVPLEQISPIVVEATLLQEDSYFRYHLGINPISLARAFWQTFIRGGRRMGGSTLTMQLARILFGINSKSLSGKIAQITRAFELELLYSKRELLEAYLNLVPYGLNIEGIGAASLIYFQKPAANLSAVEALALVVIPQNPSRRSAKSGGMSTASAAARLALFRRWLRGKPESEQSRYLSELRLPLTMHLPSELPFRAPHLVEMLLRRPHDHTLVSTLDLKLQSLVERQVKSYVSARKASGIHNTSVLIVDRETMEVRALQGSADYFSDAIEGQVNGVEAKRSPGSTLKPFVYALAFQQGLIHPLSIVKDAPMSFGAFDPENFDGKYQGPVSAANALIRSRNLPAVSLSLQLKSPNLYELLRTAGVTRLKEEEYYGLSVALGGVDVSMLELVRLYAALANGGILRPLKLIKDSPRDTETRLLSTEAADITLDVLSGNPRPEERFQREWTRNSMAIPWKTGTSQGFRDAWAIGVLGRYVVAVWVGNFNAEPNPAFIGREAAGPLFFDLMDGIVATERDLVPPMLMANEKVREVRVCAVSGKLPGPHCKALAKTWFLPGVSPIDVCDIHREILVNATSGRRICEGAAIPSSAHRTVYEFWPSDLLKLFTEAGIPRRTPPPYEENCSIGRRAEAGFAPVISSPKRDLVYAVRMGMSEKFSIPLIASADADIHQLFWFGNNSFLGRSPPQKPFFWKALPGQYVIRVVDDRGRSNTQHLDVVLVK